MQIFHTKAAKTFAAQLTQLFTPAAVYYIYLPDTAAVTTAAHAYAQEFQANNAAKHLAMISLPDAAIVPYLTVRSNLLINGQAVPFDILPEAFRRDTLFLDQDATQITAEQSLYIQLFRGILAGRQFMLMTDFPDSMSPQEKRVFLDYAEEAVAKTGTSLIILTQDHNLITANPATSWPTPPTLVPTQTK